MWTVVDIFCGMGGLSWGFKKYASIIGYDKGKWQIVNYRKNVSDAFRVDLLRSIPSIKPDILLAGPPCEPFSILNQSKTKYSKHPAFPCTERAIEIMLHLRPKVFVMEQVPNARRFITYYLSDLKVYDYYEVRLIELCYADFGVPTKRRQLFVFCSIRNVDRICDELLNMKVKRWKTVGEAISYLENHPYDPSINHIWRRTSKSRNAYYSYCTKLHYDKPAPTFGNPDKEYVFHPKLDRTISVREAMEIMGFPKSYKFLTITPLRDMYEMVVDSVSPIVSTKIADALHETEFYWNL